MTEEQLDLSHSLSLADLGRAIWRARGFIAASILICELLAVAVLLGIPPSYPVEMLLTPQQGNASNAAPSLGSGGGSGALSVASSILGLSGDGGNTDFEKFRVLYISPQTVAIVDRKFHLLRRSAAGWNEREQRWEMPPLSASNAFQRLIRWVFGRPVWRAPNFDDVAFSLGNQITIGKRTTDPFLVVSTRSTDPQFAESLIVALADAANEVLRARAQQQAAAQISYLGHELETVSNSEHRLVLTQLLLGQEQTLMLSSSNLPYAAQVLTPPTVRYDQGTPGITLTLFGGFLVGCLAGIFIAFLREASARSRQEVARDSVEVIRALVGRRAI